MRYPLATRQQYLVGIGTAYPQKAGSWSTKEEMNAMFGSYSHGVAIETLGSIGLIAA
jgi:hypothetical protein